MPPRGKPGEVARPSSGGSDALVRLRRGEITLDAYLDLRADEGVQAIKTLVSKDRLATVRETIREALASDPVLLQMIRQTTGLDPERERKG